jgi:hypothetical protein
MVENVNIKKGETFEKKILFEGVDYLTSTTSCGCTATESIEIKNEGFEATISYKGSSVGKVNQWIKFKVVDKEGNKNKPYQIKVELKGEVNEL